jgi:hypothetical protein
MLLRSRVRKFVSPVAMLLCVMAAAQNPSLSPRKLRPRMPAAASAPTVPVSQGSWSQLAKLTVNHFSESLGATVAVSGATVVASQLPLRSVLAFVYQGSKGGWSNTLPVASLATPNSNVLLGVAVAIDGDTIVLGTPAFENDGPGYALVYVKPAGGWTDMFPTAILTPSGTNDGFFGGSVSISGDTIVVGDTSFDTSGTAFVYVKPAGGWTNMTETAKLTASDELSTDEFSASVSVSGSTIAVGAPSLNQGSGKAYVFVEPAGGWTNMTETAKLGASDALADARVGVSISIDGNNVIAGAPNPANAIPGAAYIFTKPAAGWRNMTQTAELSAADGVASNFFGGSVSISGNLAIVGAPFRGAAPDAAQGGIYVFQQPAGGWQNASSSTVLTASDVHHNADFGTALSISGKTVVGGSEYLLPNAAYVFGLP